MHRTTVFSSFAASILKRLTEVAQTDVSRLGKMFSTTFLPLSSLREIGERSDLITVKSGASEPILGSELAV
jgi:hypothetical protein